MPRVRVVVVNWNSAWFTARCVRSLLATEWDPEGLEIVVVDNGSVDGSLELLVHQFPHIRFVRNGANLGFAEGCNRAMRDLDGVDYVALVNNDAVVDPGWLAPLVAALEGDACVGAAAARLVLEPLFVPVDVEIAAGTAAIERVVVAGIDATSRTQFLGTRPVGDIYWPMDVTHHVDDAARLMVPAGPGDPQVELTVRGDGSLSVKTAGGSGRAAGSTCVELHPGRSTTVVVAGGERRVELLNGIGTDRGADSEGFDRHFGEISADLSEVADLSDTTGLDMAGPGWASQPVQQARSPRGDVAGSTSESVPGFCGGGVLLRSEMLDQIGLFDPSFFAYYEDMDLSWRATRAGWRIVAVPGSVIRHAFGGSGGSANPVFFFLNYRNWLLTVIRNADREERRLAFRSLWDRLKWALRSNVLSPIRHFRKPKFRLVKAWGRVVLAVLLAAPGLLARKRSGILAGVTRTSRVRSWLQPESKPGSPAPRPGGPLVVYLDLSAWFDSPTPAVTGDAPALASTSGQAEAPSASALEVLEELLGSQQLIQVLPVRGQTGRAELRRLSATEMGHVLTPGGSRLMATNPAESVEAGGGPIDEVFRVRTSTPGTIVVELCLDGALVVDGSEIVPTNGPDNGFAEVLLARYTTR